MENLDLSKFKKDKTLYSFSDEKKQYGTEELGEISKEDQKKMLQLQSDIASGIEDIDEARETISNIRKYISPIISIPEDYYEKIKKTGKITAQESWIPGDKTLAATIGVKSYEGVTGKKRVLFQIKPHVPVEPRITRKNSVYGFYGVVYVPSETLDLRNDVTAIH